MSDTLLRIYHRLPHPLRSVAASVRGYHLSRWRYGRETERLVEEALGREQWSPQRWKEWQAERVVRLLHHAATNVPYYSEYWLQRRRRGDGASWERLEHWPVLSKETVRTAPQAFVAQGRDTRRMFEEHTSGTTGTPLRLWYDRETIRHWYALSEARWRRWYGVSSADRWAIIGGQRVVPFGQVRPPFWVWNAGLRQLYMSAQHIRPDFLSHYLNALERYRITYIYGYASALYSLALRALETQTPLSLRVAITNAEPFYDYQREVIARAFQCPARETYGLSEYVCAMSECERTSLHLWPEAGYVEVLDEENRPVQPGETGRLVCTGLLNDGMPLIRYDVQDMMRQPIANGLCACGRGLPLMGKVLGRLDDAIVTRDGRRLALLDIIFEPSMHVREAQIVQETLETIRVRVVPADGWGSKDEQAIRTALRERMGDVEVIVETVREIERTWAGKLRIMVSKVASA